MVQPESVHRLAPDRLHGGQISALFFGPALKEIAGVFNKTREGGIRNAGQGAPP